MLRMVVRKEAVGIMKTTISDCEDDEDVDITDVGDSTI